MQRLFSWIKQHKLLAAVALLLLAAALVALSVRFRRLETETRSPPIQRGSIIESVYGIGTVKATRSFQFRPGVPTTIYQVYVKEGDTVKRGQRLLGLEGVGALAAPFGGTITSLPFKVGETVFAQAVVLQLVDLRDRYLSVSVEQRGALRVRAGQKARISIEGMRDQYYEGVVDSVYAQNNDFLVRIDVSKLPPQVLPDMTADVAIGVAEHSDVLLIPVSALNNGTVNVQRGAGASKSVAVKTGIVDGEMAEVVSGDVHEGDRLIIRGKTKP
jgi:macrolide-specific efflux system membrane fusion protein